MRTKAPMDQDLREFVLRVFKELWDDYVSWENKSSLDMLQSLSYVSSERTNAQSLEQSQSPLTTDSNSPSPSSSSEDEVTDTRCQHSFKLREVDPTTRRAHTRVVHTTIVELPSKYAPTPPYESCAPTRRQILRGDDPPEMPFVPYADEPSFDIDAYADDHDAFAWQVDRMSDSYCTSSRPLTP